VAFGVYLDLRSTEAAEVQQEQASNQALGSLAGSWQALSTEHQNSRKHNRNNIKALRSTYHHLTASRHSFSTAIFIYMGNHSLFLETPSTAQHPSQVLARRPSNSLSARQKHFSGRHL